MLWIIPLTCCLVRSFRARASREMVIFGQEYPALYVNETIKGP